MHVFILDNSIEPASTAGKAPASTANKAPASEAAKATKKPSAAKKTAKKVVESGDGDKKKGRKKARKETYSSYIYKGLCSICILWSAHLILLSVCSVKASAP